MDSDACRLLKLPPEVLVDALLQLARQNKSGKDLVAQLVATPEEILRRFRSKVQGMRKSKKFLWGRECRAYAKELLALLQTLSNPGITPKAGLEAMVKFFESDTSVFGRCDDSSGHVIKVFRCDATEVFVRFASAYDDKPRLSKVLLKLILDNPYGARDQIFRRATEFLPPALIRDLITLLRILSKDAAESSSLTGVASTLAVTLLDPELYLEINTQEGALPGQHVLLELARICLRKGNPEAALQWIKKTSEDGVFLSFEKGALLAEIHKALGNRGELERLAHAALLKEPSTKNLATLVALCGPERQPALIEEVHHAFLQQPGFSARAALFFAEAGSAPLASEYILNRRDAISGSDYSLLLPLIARMEGMHLCVTALYRALLAAILEPPIPTAYGHAARYLHALNALAQKIEHWFPLEPHTDYFAAIQKRHLRKTAFWSRYEQPE
jgi:hypothetical protein